MEKNNLVQKAKSGLVTAFVGDFFLEDDKKEQNLPEKVGEYLLKRGKFKKISQALKMVNLADEVLDFSFNELSSIQLKKISFVSDLVGEKTYLILNYFEKGLNYKEKNHFKRLLKKIAHEYNRKVIVITNDAEFLVDLVDKIIIVAKENFIEVFDKKDFYNLKLYNFLDKPEIVSFSEACFEKGIKIEKYLENNELVKAIYRVIG